MQYEDTIVMMSPGVSSVKSNSGKVNNILVEPDGDTITAYPGRAGYSVPRTYAVRNSVNSYEDVPHPV